jgi:hypothetical protein
MTALAQKNIWWNQTLNKKLVVYFLLDFVLICIQITTSNSWDLNWGLISYIIDPLVQIVLFAVTISLLLLFYNLFRKQTYSFKTLLIKVFQIEIGIIIFALLFPGAYRWLGYF